MSRETQSHQSIIKEISVLQNHIEIGWEDAATMLSASLEADLVILRDGLEQFKTTLMNFLETRKRVDVFTMYADIIYQLGELRDNRALIPPSEIKTVKAVLTALQNDITTEILPLYGKKETELL